VLGDHKNPGVGLVWGSGGCFFLFLLFCGFVFCLRGGLLVPGIFPFFLVQLVVFFFFCAPKFGAVGGGNTPF